MLNKYMVVLTLALAAVWTLDVIPESIKITYVNDKYVVNASANVRRYGRKSSYYVNVRAVLQHTWTNNVSVHVVLTEYLHNEYRPSFIEFHYRTCDLIQNEIYMGGMIRKTGLTCPIPQGPVTLANLTLNTQNFPNVWPFEKGGAKMRFSMTDTDETIAEGEVHMRFVQKKLRPKQ